MIREETASNDSRSAQVPEWQVLVVGDGIAGLATAGFLRRFGLEPVVVGDESGRIDGSVLLPGPSLRALAELGIAEDIRTRGTVVTAVIRETATRRTVHEPQKGPPYVVDRRTLRDALDRLVPDRFRHENTAVVELDNRTDVVAVTFEGGVTERFDAVVGCDAPDSVVRAAVTDRVRESVDTTTWCVPVDATRWESAVLDRWHDASVLTLLPTDGGSFARLTVAGKGATPLDAVDKLTTHDGTARDIRSAVGEDAGVCEAGVRAVPMRAEGRLALVGDAARPAHPATGASVSAALTDARAVASALTDGTGNISRRLERYGAHRPEPAGSADAPEAGESADEFTTPLGRLYAARNGWLRRTCLGDESAAGGRFR